MHAATNSDSAGGTRGVGGRFSCFPFAKHAWTREPRGIAVRVTFAFVVAGCAWILLTDIVIYRAISDPVMIARLETAKGWGFVAATAVLIYLTVWASVIPLAR